MGDESSNPAGRVKRNRFRRFAGISSSQPLATPRASSGFAKPRAVASLEELVGERAPEQPGSAKRMVPSETTAAPAATSSRASSPEPTPPIPTIGHVDRSGARRDARERDRLQRRSGVAAGAAAELRAQRLRVERHAADRVDEREAVRAGGDDRPRRLGDVPGRRRELRVERLRGARAAAGDDLRRRLGRLLDVRAREVELDRLDIGAIVEALADAGVVVGGEAADRDPDAQAEPRERGQRLVEEAVDAGALQADRVEHARAPSRRSARAGCPRAAAA